MVIQSGEEEEGGMKLGVLNEVKTHSTTVSHANQDIVESLQNLERKRDQSVIHLQDTIEKTTDDDENEKRMCLDGLDSEEEGFELFS